VYGAHITSSCVDSIMYFYISTFRSMCTVLLLLLLLLRRVFIYIYIPKTNSAEVKKEELYLYTPSRPLVAYKG
jgi:hypothetical protein